MKKKEEMTLGASEKKEEIPPAPKASEKILQEIADLRADLRTTLTTNEKGGKKAMEGCLDCVKKDNEKNIADMKHEHEMEKVEIERDALKQRLDTLGKGHIAPTAELFEHFENCPNCKPEFKKLLEAYTEPAFIQGKQSINMDDVREKLKSEGFAPPIKRIVIK